MWLKEFFAEYQIMIIGITAIAAIFFSVWLGWLARQHNRLSVKPHLSINYISESDDTGQCFELVNNGIGPAIIKTYTMLVNGKPYEIKTIDDAIKVFEILDIKKEDFLILNRLEKGDALKVGYAKPLISISKKYRASNEANSNFRKAVFKIGFEIKYESMYEEDFILKREPITPTQEIV